MKTVACCLNSRGGGDNSPSGAKTGTEAVPLSLPRSPEPWPCFTRQPCPHYRSRLAAAMRTIAPPLERRIDEQVRALREEGEARDRKYLVGARARAELGRAGRSGDNQKGAPRPA